MYGDIVEKNVKLIKDDMSEKIISTAERLVTNFGPESVTVRMILKELDVTNRVFYNRFHNIDEVLEIVYLNTISKIREGMVTEYDGKQDFFDYVVDVVSETLIASYDTKMKFNQYVFVNDSVTHNNYLWYMERIKTLFEYADKYGYIKSVDHDALSYAIWCFCRGYNADAVVRLPKEEAIKNFKYSFRFLLDGLKKNN